jgi:hypothetical protein
VRGDDLSARYFGDRLFAKLGLLWRARERGSKVVRGTLRSRRLVVELGAISRLGHRESRGEKQVCEQSVDRTGV